MAYECSSTNSNIYRLEVLNKDGKSGESSPRKRALGTHSLVICSRVRASVDRLSDFRMKELPDPYAGCDESSFRERTVRNLRQTVDRVQQLPLDVVKGGKRIAEQSIAAVIPLLP